MGGWDAWIGREETRSDSVDEQAVGRWLATFDRALPADGCVPQGYHWCLCPPDAPTGGLGVDGHPAREESPASFLPPVPLPRRMWASSEVEFVAPLRPGQAVERISRVASVTEKHGGSGTLVFAAIAHETFAGGRVVVRETQSLVFRAPPPAGAAPAPSPLADTRFDPSDWAVHRVIRPSEPLLFRYSALTFNTHRIHYDLPYAMEAEGYRGLVVHGPLIATLLLDLAQRHFGDNALRRFSYRGNMPAICGEELHLVLRASGDSIDIGAFAADGRRITTASAMM